MRNHLSLGFKLGECEANYTGIMHSEGMIDGKIGNHYYLALTRANHYTPPESPRNLIIPSKVEIKKFTEKYLTMPSFRIIRSMVFRDRYKHINHDNTIRITCLVSMYNAE